MLDLVFLIPLIVTFGTISVSWGEFDSLLDLIMTLFLGAWMIGWSTAPIIMTLILLLMLFGREVIRARPGEVELFAGVAGIGMTMFYDVRRMRNLRLEHSAEKGGNSWRKAYVAFDYGANPIAFGSDIDAAVFRDVESGIEAASASLIGTGEARPEDIEGEWESAEQSSAAVSMPLATPETRPITWSSPSSVALIAANLVPLAGAVFLGWNLSDVMVLYWAESAVIGLFNLLKIIVIGRWGALFHGPFFLGHFGGFMAVHFLFIYTFFVAGVHNDGDASGDLAVVGKLFLTLWPALAALFVSHAYSFFRNFIGREEYGNKTMAQQMAEPYSRIIFMHLVIIFGGGLSMFLQNPAPVLLIVIVLKVIMDLKAHIKERAGAQAGRAAEK